MGDWRQRLSEEDRARLKKAVMPKWSGPMLATLTGERFSSKEWLFERKLDGERCLVFRDDQGAALYSRNRKSLNATYPELVDVLERATGNDYIADGEIVAFSGGLTSFSRLQKRIGITDAAEARRSDVRVWVYLFDLLYYDGSDIRDLPLRTRKRILRREMRFRDALRFTPHRNETGEAFFEAACDKGWEGLIAKRADAPYRSGRARDWLKFKCVNRQEFVIGGYTDPQGRREGFGALLIGYYEQGKLRYAGRVGTGFDEDTLERLHGRLESRARKRPAFADPPADDDAKIHWVSPELVAEVGFTEWTDDGYLRHPRFLGLRNDKAPHDVHREEAAK